jgi:hypothetical protein
LPQILGTRCKGLGVGRSVAEVDAGDVFLGDFAGRGLTDIEDEFTGFGCGARQFGFRAGAVVGGDSAVGEDVGYGVGSGHGCDGLVRDRGLRVDIAAVELLRDSEGLGGLEVDQVRSGMGGWDKLARRLSRRGGDADGAGCERLAGFAVDEADAEGLLSGARECGESEGGKGKCGAEVFGEHEDLFSGASQ